MTEPVVTPPLIMISEHQGRWLATCEDCGRVAEHGNVDAALRDARWHAEEHPIGAVFRVTVAGHGPGEIIQSIGRGAEIRELAQ